MILDVGVKQPRRATVGSIGYDFFAKRDIILEPGLWTVVDTGVKFTDADKVKGREEWAMMLLPRSGQGFKYGVRLRNTAGIIDCDYRDNIMASLSCDKACVINKGDAFMQGIIIPRFTFDKEIAPLTTRDGGFGSTDKKEGE